MKVINASKAHKAVLLGHSRQQIKLEYNRTLSQQSNCCFTQHHYKYKRN